MPATIKGLGASLKGITVMTCDNFLITKFSSLTNRSQLSFFRCKPSDFVGSGFTHFAKIQDRSGSYWLHKIRQIKSIMSNKVMGNFVSLIYLTGTIAISETNSLVMFFKKNFAFRTPQCRCLDQTKKIATTFHLLYRIKCHNKSNGTVRLQSTSLSHAD